jgi:cytochrome b561
MTRTEVDGMTSGRSAPSAERYAATSVFFHWMMAALVIATLLVAWRLEQSTGAQRGALIRLHKSIGLTILVLAAGRVLNLILARHPGAIPLSRWERHGARIVHAAFYLLLVAIPLSGWAMISADAGKTKTFWWGWLYWPKISWLTDLPPAARLSVHGALATTHLALALTLVALLAVHLAAVIKHEAFDNVRQVRRMFWKH